MSAHALHFHADLEESDDHPEGGGGGSARASVGHALLRSRTGWAGHPLGESGDVRPACRVFSEEEADEGGEPRGDAGGHPRRCGPRLQAHPVGAAVTGLDTNVLVRYLTQDDAAQFQAALRLLNRKGLVFHVPDFVLVEMDWVLSSVYDWSREEVAETLARLLTIHNLAFEDESRIRGALRALRSGADLADALIAARCQEQDCRDLATFDKGMVKHFPKFAFVPK